ncbi:MAG TPA: ABC transporter ATP-binding protein [Acidimicrobiales bacterium]|nr:ABC transporter ATP-binding protein [Acidimicrobiales bacterium]
MALLEIKDLHVSFPTDDGVVKAVRGVSFSVEQGKTLGIVGESGSGKSVSTQTIMGLTRGAEISGQALFKGADLLTMTRRELEQVRGREIAMVFQDPLSSLHPYYRVGWQIGEMIRAHDKGVSKKVARARAVDLLRLVGIPRPDVRVDDFPHQFSGGMRQRAMIAMAMALNPSLLIADEPTTALDVTVQAQVLQVIKRLQEEFGTAVIIITHDLGVIAETADDVVVMYAGAIMESGHRDQIFYENHHPYTEGLLRSLPAYGDDRERLLPIPGQPPSLINLPSGCKFHPRCPYAFDRCLREEPPLTPVGGEAEHKSSCWLPHGLEERAEVRRRVLAQELAS